MGWVRVWICNWGKRDVTWLLTGEWLSKSLVTCRCTYIHFCVLHVTVNKTSHFGCILNVIFDFNLNLEAECPNFWVWLWSSRGLELKLEQKNELLGNFFKVTDRTGNVWEVWHSSVTKINCHHFTMVARTCASRVASLPSVDVARSESGELSKDGHRPSIRYS